MEAGWFYGWFKTRESESKRGRQVESYFDGMLTTGVASGGAVADTRLHNKGGRKREKRAVLNRVDWHSGEGFRTRYADGGRAAGSGFKYYMKAPKEKRLLSATRKREEGMVWFSGVVAGRVALSLTKQGRPAAATCPEGQDVPGESERLQTTEKAEPAGGARPQQAAGELPGGGSQGRCEPGQASRRSGRPQMLGPGGGQE